MHSTNKQTNSEAEVVYLVPIPEDTAWFEASQKLGPDAYGDSTVQREIAPDHISPERGIGLGREAVSAAFNDMDTCGPLPYFSESLGRHVTAYPCDVNHIREAYMKNARQKLHELSDEQKGMFEVLIGQQPMPQWLNELVGLNEADIHDPNVDKTTPLISKLTQKDAEGNYTVGDRTFQNFLEWHNYCLTQEQKAFDTQKETYVRTFDEALQQAVKAGWMPKKALLRLGRLNSAIIVVDDGFDTDLEGRGGYKSLSLTDTGKAVIVLSPDRMSRKHTFMHEAVHVIHGRQLDDGEGNYGRYKIGELFDGKEFASKTIVEACVEHITGALEGDDIDDLKPEEHKQAYAYHEQRRLLQALCETGVEKVDIRLFIGALMEELGDLQVMGQKTANEKLATQLKAAFPDRDILQEVAHLGDIDDVQRLTWNLEEEAFRRKNLTGRIVMGAVRALESVTRNGYTHKVARKQKKTIAIPSA